MKSILRGISPDCPLAVLLDAIKRERRGRRPVAVYRDERNPIKALKRAIREVWCEGLEVEGPIPASLVPACLDAIALCVKRYNLPVRRVAFSAFSKGTSVDYLATLDVNVWRWSIVTMPIRIKIVRLAE